MSDALLQFGIAYKEVKATSESARWLMGLADLSNPAGSTLSVGEVAIQMNHSIVSMFVFGMASAHC